MGRKSPDQLPKAGATRRITELLATMRWQTRLRQGVKGFIKFQFKVGDVRDQTACHIHLDFTPRPGLAVRARRAEGGDAPSLVCVEGRERETERACKPYERKRMIV